MAISIHALREEGDAIHPARNPWTTNFYPRPPRGGRLRSYGGFQVPGHFYPRPPRGGRPVPRVAGVEDGQFLSTPSARRATVLRSLAIALRVSFLSTPSARRATLWQVPSEQYPADFYPRPPRGGRRFPFLMRSMGTLFLSTPSARRATAKAAKKSTAFLLLYTFVHKLESALTNNLQNSSAVCTKVSGFAVRSPQRNRGNLYLAQRGY